jgi:peptidoglycan/xylan/chitin deacetylase (PgdA/CDA1 family)
VPDTLVLCYHAVSETFPADLSVTPGALHDQLDWLHRRGYRGVTFTEAVETPSQGKRVAVTFDDAFASVEGLGKPVLDALGWPATVFAVSEFARGGRPITWQGTDQWAATEHAGEMRSLDWSRLRALATAGWEIGSHTATHPHLTTVDDTTLERELEDSREAVEEAMKTRCASIAYPYGDVDPRVVAATARAGYRTAAALPDVWIAEQPLEFPRAGIYHGDDLRRFRLKVSPWVRSARRALRR